MLFLCATRVCKPGSVLTAIYLVPQLLAGSSRLLGAVGQTCMLLHGVAPDRVYIVKPVSLQAGWALTPPFHPCCKANLAAVYLCCTCPGVTPGGHYPLSLPYGARTFLTWGLSAPSRGCPTRSRKYCNPTRDDCQISCKFFSESVYYKQQTGAFIIRNSHRHNRVIANQCAHWCGNPFSFWESTANCEVLGMRIAASLCSSQ